MLTNPGEINDLTRDIIGGAIRVHRRLGGPGLLETTYSVCFVAELKSRGHAVQRNVPVPVVYRGIRVEAAYWIDVLVDNRVIVELKAVEKLHAVHVAQLLTDLRLTNRRGARDQHETAPGRRRHEPRQLVSRSLRSFVPPRSRPFPPSPPPPPRPPGRRSVTII